MHRRRGLRSARLDSRTGLVDALAALKAHRAGVLVVAKRDRLARDVGLAVAIDAAAGRAGAEVHSADGVGNGSSPEAVLLRRITDAVAEHERSLIRARTRAALQAKRARGELVGSVPYGYALAPDGVHLEVDPDEQAVVHRIRELRTTGTSQRAIVDLLNREGVPCRGSRWHRTSVQRALARPE